MFFRRNFLPLLIYLIYSCLRFTWRIQIIESASFRAALDSKRPIVMGHWHGHELGLIQLLKPYKIAAMVSTSKDGELMDRVIHLFGAKTSRGSSTRGGAAALKGIIRLSREGWHPSVAVDGPKGPIYKVKPGIFEISKLINAEIVPVAVACDRKKVFEKAWNKTFLPLPFARLVIVWGETLPAVPRDADSRSPRFALDLESALTAAEFRARSVLIDDLAQSSQD